MRTLARMLIGTLLAFVLSASASAQTGVGATSRLISGGTLPATCVVGSVYEKTGASAGLYVCLTTNTWTIAGIQFADLPSPPPGTALGSVSLPYTTLNLSGNLSGNGSFNRLGGTQAPTEGTFGFSDISLVAIAGARDNGRIVSAPQSDGFAGSTFTFGFVSQAGDQNTQTGDTLAANVLAYLGELFVDYEDTTDKNSVHFGVIFQGPASEQLSINVVGDVGIGNTTPDYGSVPVDVSDANLFVAGATGNGIFKGSATATDFIWTGTKTANFVLAGPTTGAAAVPAFRALVAADIPSLSYAPLNHNILSVTHGDTTAASVVRGDLITGQGASPTWKRLAKGTANQVLAMDGTATDVLWVTPASGGVTSLTATSPISRDVSTGAVTVSLLVNTDFLFTASQSVTETVNATSTDGLVLTNTATALTGAQQWSPRLRLSGQGFKSNSVSASQAADWIIETRPVQGTTVSTSQLSFSSQIAGAGYNQRAYFTDAGNLQLIQGGNTSVSVGSGLSNGMFFSGGTTVAFAVNGAQTMTLNGGGSPSVVLASGAPLSWNNDLDLRRSNAAVLQMGDDVNGAAVNQTFQCANGITGTNVTGGNCTFSSGSGTGTGAISALIFRSPTLGTTGTTAQVKDIRLTIDQTSVRATVPVTGIYLQETTIYSAAGTALPACAAGTKGAQATVSDATSPTFRSTYASGGAVIAHVFCDGTNWLH